MKKTVEQLAYEYECDFSNRVWEAENNPNQLMVPVNEPSIHFIAGYNKAIQDLRKDKQVESPTIPVQPNMAAGSFVGSCGKCGAPYIMYTGVWMGVTPPPIQPTCVCCNRATITTTTTSYDSGGKK